MCKVYQIWIFAQLEVERHNLRVVNYRAKGKKYKVKQFQRFYEFKFFFNFVFSASFLLLCEYVCEQRFDDSVEKDF